MSKKNPKNKDSFKKIKFENKTTGTAICMTNEEGIFEYVNKSFCSLYEFSEEELLGSHFEVILAENIERLNNLYHYYFSRKKMFHGEFQVLTRSKIRLTVLCSSIYIETTDGKTKIVCFIIDITERKKTEEKLKIYAKQLEEQSIELKKAYTRIQNNMKQARKLHDQLLPKYEKIGGSLDFATYFHPACQLGGDYYNYFKFRNKVIFYVIDVSGHGLDGAMLTIYLKNTVDHILEQIEEKGEELNPSHILKKLAEKYINDSFGDDEYFICFFLGVIDMTDFSFVFASSGFQTPLLIFDEGGNIQLINLGGLPISSAVSFEHYEFNNVNWNIEKGMSLLVLTDGIIEEERENEKFGLDRIVEVIAKSGKKSALHVKEEIVSCFYNFIKNENTVDDITFLIMKRLC